MRNAIIYDLQTTSTLKDGSWHDASVWSTDGYNWKEIDRVEASGFSQEMKNYSITDYSLTSGVCYYQLEQVDLDGAGEFSKIVSISSALNKHDLKLKPNPANTSAFLIVQGLESSNQVEVLNALGQVVYAQVLNGQEQLSLDLFNFEKGAYMVRSINSQTEEIQVQRLIVQ